MKKHLRSFLPALTSLLILHVSDGINAQTAKTIKDVRFEGLEKTKPEYLRRFIQTKAGTTLDASQLQQDAQYLSNVPFILNARVRVRAADSGARGLVVSFQCEEQHTLVPILNFGGLPDNLWFRAGASEANLLGRGIKVSGFYRYYDRHSYQLNVGYPFIGGSSWGANIRLTKWSTREPLYFKKANNQQKEVTYNYDNYNLELTGNYKFSTGARPYSDKLTFGGVVFRERYKKNVDMPEMPLPSPQAVTKDKFLAKLIYDKDHLDYEHFYVRGFHNSLHIQTVFTCGRGQRFDLFFNDLKYFRRVGEQGNWANRLRLVLSTNRESPFAPFVLDNSVNVRGVGNRIDRGTGTVVYNTEYRHTLYENDFGAIQGVGFADLGTCRQPGGYISGFSGT